MSGECELVNAVLLVALGVVLSLVSMAAGVHFFLRVFAFVRDGVDTERRGPGQAAAPRPWRGN